MRRQPLRGRDARRIQTHTTPGPSFRAPIQVIIVCVLTLSNRKVATGNLILVLKSMEMEKPILVHEAGQIVDTYIKPGGTVKVGDLMISTNPIEKAQ